MIKTGLLQLPGVTDSLDNDTTDARKKIPIPVGIPRCSSKITINLEFLILKKFIHHLRF